MKQNFLLLGGVTFGLLTLTACFDQKTGSNNLGGSTLKPSSEISTAPPLTDPRPNPIPTPTTTPPPSKPERTYQVDALLFVGDGTWGTEVGSLENIMEQHHMTYREVTSRELDAMSLDAIAKYGVIVWPGGSGGTQARSLTAQTHANLRAAVQQRGVSYIGFCAGAFVGVAPAPKPGKDVSYGLGIVAGPELDYYYLEYQGTTIAMTMATFPDGSKRDLLWYGGPVTPNIPGGVVAKYPTGDPMITETWSGNGFVILSAVHPAAPLSVSSSYGLRDSDGNDFEFTYQLIQAALHQQPMKAF